MGIRFHNSVDFLFQVLQTGLLKTMSAIALCVLSSGTFLLVGLLTGLWKYLCMQRSEQAEAPYYVNIAHRAALMYAFAALVMAELCRHSAWPDAVNFLAALIPIIFFALAIATYVMHGALNDTDNQLRKPHRLGGRTLPAWMIPLFMLALAAGEIGGIAVLLAGAAAGI